MRTTRTRARLISEYVDARLRRQAPADEPAGTSADQDFDELLDLTRDLSRIEVVPPRASEDAVLQRLARQVAVAPAPRRSSWFPAAWRAATALPARLAAPAPAWVASMAALATVVLGLVVWLPGADTSLKAADLLARADRLDAVVSRTEVLYREVRTGFRTTNGGDVAMTTTTREWVEGTGARSAAEVFGPDGRLLSRSVNISEGPDAGSRMLLHGGAAPAPGSVLVVRPGARDLADALERMPPDVRRRLQPILSRRNVVSEPVWSDRLENRILLGIQPREPLPGETVDVSPWTPPGGGRGYRLTVSDNWRPWVEWRGDGLAGLPARFQRVRYIDGKSFLTVRDEVEYRLDDGRVFAYQREVLHTAREPLARRGHDPFRLDVPPGTTIRRLPAEAELRAIDDAIRRAPSPTH